MRILSEVGVKWLPLAKRSHSDLKAPIIDFFEFWLATVWMLMVTEGEHREDFTVYELAKERKKAPASWWTVPPMPMIHEPPPPPALTSNVVEVMVQLLECENYSHTIMRRGGASVQSVGPWLERRSKAKG